MLALIILVLATIFESTAAAVENTTQSADKRPQTTYERFLPLAVAGDPAIQHFLGYMYFFGEGVDLSYEESHNWFHEAAEEGDFRAQRNLGIFHSRAIPRIPEKFYDAREANRWYSVAAANLDNPDYSKLASDSYKKFLASTLKEAVQGTDRARLGETVYLSTCAGCHGFNGRAAFPDVPSFGHGDRLEKSDSDLVKSILHGAGSMPGWKKHISAVTAQKVLSYIRDEFGRSATREIAKLQQVSEHENSQLVLGEEVYLSFCGGCHGFNGIAWYVNSPSFALRERLNKSDEELTNSLKNGLNAMPAWENMLRPAQIDALVKFIRTLAPSYESGIAAELRRPEKYLRFQPKNETRKIWTGDDSREP
jgi:mono/diheme cytochrome c family protein